MPGLIPYLKIPTVVPLFQWYDCFTPEYVPIQFTSNFLAQSLLRSIIALQQSKMSIHYNTMFMKAVFKQARVAYN